MSRLFPSLFFGLSIIFVHKLNDLRLGFAVKRYSNETSPREILHHFTSFGAFSKCDPMSQMLPIFSSVALFPSVVHFSKRGNFFKLKPFFQIMTYISNISSVAQFPKYVKILQVWQCYTYFKG